MGLNIKMVAVMSCDEPACCACDEFSEDLEHIAATQFGGVAKGELLKSGWSHEMGFGYRCPTHTHYPNMTHDEIDDACDAEAEADDDNE